MVTEAVCKEIARTAVESGTFLALGPESQVREYNRIQNKYAHPIHASYVDSQLMRTDLVNEVALIAPGDLAGLSIGTSNAILHDS